VSASSVSEQERKVIPRRYTLHKVRGEMVLETYQRMCAILWRGWRKTDRPGSSKILLPESWNQAESELDKGEAISRFRLGAVPNRTLCADLARRFRLPLG